MSRAAIGRFALALAISWHAAAAAAGGDKPDFEFLPVPSNRANAAKPVPKYRFMFGEPARWSGPVRWKYNHSGAPSPFDGDPAGTLEKVRAALDSWTQSCGIQYVYEGETAVPPNHRFWDPRFGEQPDNLNVVGWGQLDGNQTGLAWAWFDEDGSGRFLTDADIVLSSDRVSSALEIQRTGSHEWGHAIGLAHSNLHGTLMSGPPDSAYNALRGPMADDLRGCRCLYGPPAGQQSGYSCSLPTKVELGTVAIGDGSAARAVTLTNHGNGPLGITSVVLSTVRLVGDDGCPAGSALAPGQSCTVALVARPTLVFDYHELITFNTSDGAYPIAVTFSGSDTPPVTPAVVQLVEYVHTGFGHYFLTHLPGEIAKLDNGTLSGWSRTGRAISAWVDGTGITSPVCRFFSDTFAPKSSHFYTSFPAECQTVRSNPSWSFEGEVFHVDLPDAQGRCASGTQSRPPALQQRAERRAESSVHDRRRAAPADDRAGLAAGRRGRGRDDVRAYVNKNLVRG